MKYNLATIINTHGIKMKNDSIHKVKQPFPWARTASCYFCNRKQEKYAKDRARSSAKCILTHTD